MIIDSSKLVMIGLSLVVNMELFSITTNRTRGHHQALAGGYFNFSAKKNVPC